MAWEEADRNGPGKGKAHQEMLRGFEWKDAWRRSLSLDGGGWGRKGSAVSGVSPGGSRVGSVDDNFVGGMGRRASAKRRVSAQSAGGDEGPRGSEVETVVEE